MVSSTTIDSLQSRSKSGLLYVDVGNTDGERVGHFAQNHQQSTRESRLKARMSRTSGSFFDQKERKFLIHSAANGCKFKKACVRAITLTVEACVPLSTL